MKRSPLNQHQTGMSLIELMVSLVISTMILAGVMQVFVSSKHTYSTEEALSRMQENARFAEKKISRDIRVTGFAGCTGSGSSSLTPNVVAAPAAPANNFISGVSIAGFDSVSDGTVDIDNDGTDDITGVVAGTDVFSVSTAGACGASVVQTMTSRSANVTVSDTDSCNWTGDEYLVITNCIAMDVFRLSAAPTSSGGNILQFAHGTAGGKNSNANFSTLYDTDTMVFGFQNTTWFVKTNPETSSPGLYKKLNDDTAELMIEGIEDLQIRYGFDSDGDYIIDELKTAAAINSGASSDWKKVISVEVSMLMASDTHNLVPTPQEYSFWVDSGTTGSIETVTADDKRIYYVFTRQVTMRNLSL